MIIALLKKEVRHNFIVALAVLGLVACGVMLTGQFRLRDAQGLMAVGQLVCRALAPIYCLLAVHRLFVLEYHQGTVEFVAGLPVSLRKLTVIKLVMGAIATLGLSALIVILVAVAVSRRELVDAAWTQQILLQVLAYSFAWFGVGAGIAHLGKYSLLAWTVLAAVLGILVTISPESTPDVVLSAGMSRSVEATRFDPPWTSMVVAILWGTGGIVMAYILSGLRGGALVRRWYIDVNHRDLVVGMAVVFAITVGVGFVAEAIDFKPGGNSGAPRVNNGPVRIIGSEDSALWAIGRDVDRNLSAMGSVFGINDWAPVTLTYGNLSIESRVGRRGPHAEALNMVISRGSPIRAALRGVLYRVMEQRSHGIVTRTDWKGWILAGFAESWLGRDGSESPMYELRCAWAAREGVTVAELNSWDQLEGRFGPRVAEAVAWAGIQTVQELGGTAGVDRLLSETLAPHRSRNGLGLLMERWTSLGGPQGPIQAATGVDWAVFVDRWQATLQALQERRREDLRDVVGAPDCEVLASASGNAKVGLSWHCEQGVPISKAELLWSIASPLADYPVRGPNVRIVAMNGQASGQAGIDLAPGSRPVAAISLYVADLEARIVSGWREVGP